MAKNRFILICALLLIGGMVAAFQQTPIKEVVESQIGVQEIPKGSNTSPQIKRYLKAVKVNTPAPWCAAFVKYCLDSAGYKTTITAWSPTAHNPKNLVYFKGKWLKEMQPYDVFTIYYPSMKRIGHTGFASRKINPNVVETVEGNSNNGGSREGYIVCKRKRSPNTLYSISRWIPDK